MQALTDEEYLSQQSNKEILASVFLGVLRYVPVKEKNDNHLYELELQKKLKFKHIEDSKLLRGCIDLLEDTEYAIQDYQNFGLGNSDRISEKYLRLYGLLNSVYQQIFVIIELVELFNYQGKKKIIQDLKGLKIFDLRNKLAAHTINFQIDKSQKPTKENLDFFRLAQSTISGWGERLLVVSNKNKSETINLRELLDEYNTCAEEILVKVCQKSIHSIFPNNGEHKDWLLFRFDFVKQRLESELNEIGE